MSTAAVPTEHLYLLRLLEELLAACAAPDVRVPATDRALRAPACRSSARSRARR